jgi:hypothetical protein
MCEFLAVRLPILSTRFGARGFRLEDGETAFLFEREGLAAALTEVRRLFDADAPQLRRIAEKAHARNEAVIDMAACARPLVEAIRAAREAPQAVPEDALSSSSLPLHSELP